MSRYGGMDAIKIVKTVFVTVCLHFTVYISNMNIGNVLLTNKYILTTIYKLCFVFSTHAVRATLLPACFYHPHYLKNLGVMLV
jgi:hypothetical protein